MQQAGAAAGKTRGERAGKQRALAHAAAVPSVTATMSQPVSAMVTVVTIANADTTGGGGGTDLGLDSITITHGSVNARTGIATVSGTIDCSQDLTEAFIGVELDQLVGRFHTLRGWGGTSVDCLAADGSATWTMTIQPDEGKFANGRAVVTAFAEVDVCTDVDCFSDAVGQGPVPIRLGR